MHYKKPFYLLKINSEFTRSNVYVNGCMIDYNKKAYPVNVEYPINHYLKPGKNTIEIKITESLDRDTKIKGLLPDGKVSCQLSVVDYENPDDSKVKVADFIYSAKGLPVLDGFIKHKNMEELNSTLEKSTQPGRFNVINNSCIKDENGSINVYKTEIDYRQPRIGRKYALLTLPIELPVPFPEPVFFSGEDQPLANELDDNQFDEFSLELTKELQPIWDLVNQNRIQDLAPYFEARSREYDLAFYKESGESLRSLLANIQDKYNDKNWTLRALKPEEIGIDIFLNRKIAYLCPEPMSHALKFNDSNDLQTTYPIYWSKLNGQWKIVR